MTSSKLAVGGQKRSMTLVRGSFSGLAADCSSSEHRVWTANVACSVLYCAVLQFLTIPTISNPRLLHPELCLLADLATVIADHTAHRSLAPNIQTNHRRGTSVLVAADLHHTMPPQGQQVNGDHTC